ncbi:MAG TPA: hypothetical protein GXZ48_00045 [Acholeplasmataceae bacterium]|nr:hypothetical protein [Acholeplasmataceae bacterium]
MDKSVKLRLRIDYKAMKYFNVYNLKYKKKFFLYYIALIVICVGAGVATIITKNYFLSVLFGIFAIYLIYQLLNVEKIIDRQISSYFHVNRPIEQNIEINDENIIITSVNNPERVITYEWVHITSIHEIPQYYFLFLNKQPILLSKDEQDIIEGSQEELAKIIHEKAAAKPYKVVNKEIIHGDVTFDYPDYDAMMNNQDFQDAEEVETEDPDFDKAEEIKVEVDNLEDVEEAGNPEPEENKEND